MAEDHVRALVVTAHGDGDVLELQDQKLPPPAEGQLRVEVAASGVNFIEVYERQGVYPTTPPFVLGNEGAGEVLAVGPGVDDFAIGDIVAWSAAPGCHASGVLVDADRALRVPEGVAPELAAAALLQGMTAHYLVNTTYPVSSGDTALVHAAAGGVGHLLVQMIKSRGARVIGTVSSPEKEARARAAGADEVIRYTEVEDLAAEVRKLTDGRGVSVVYDGVGRATFDASLASLALRGMLVLYGGSSGQVPPFDPQRLNRGGSLYLTRPTLAHYTSTREELVEHGTAVLESLRNGSLHVEIYGRYPLAEAARAYADLEGRRTTGKLLLVP